MVNPETTSELAQIALRLPPELLAMIDDRAKQTGQSRNAWIKIALGYVIAELPLGASAQQRLAMRQRWLDEEI
jgi:predicted HicB family RNase H-like nuclease